MSISHISVVIMAKNAQETIALCLDALKSFDEVIVYLNSSKDNTEQIASSYSNVKVIEGVFEGFGPTKNKAASYSSNAWILSLDSDEILNQKLVSEIETLSLDKDTLYQLKRDNYFLGHKTQSQDCITRIYNKEYTHFNDNAVHEKVIHPSDAKSVTLVHAFKHLNITNINQTLTKMIHYSDLGAEEKTTCFFLVVIAKSMFAFFKTYILEKEILSGWVGVSLAINAANRRYYKYLKQYINCKNTAL